MKFAIIATGGKQYKVSEGAAYQFEKIDKKEGAKVDFNKVLFFTDGKDFKIGQPLVKGIKVSGTVEAQGKGKKITVVKYKSKVRYRRKKGHRQSFTRVKIDKIGPAK